MITGILIGFVGGIFFAAAQPGPSDLIRYAARSVWAWAMGFLPKK